MVVGPCAALAGVLLLAGAAAASPTKQPPLPVGLNIGTVSKGVLQADPNVASNGSPKQEDTWDPPPFNTLATYDTNFVDFGLWVKAGAPFTSQQIRIWADYTPPAWEPSYGVQNWARCGNMSVIDLSTNKPFSTGTIKKTTNPNATALRLRVSMPGCTQPGQSRTFVHVEYPEYQNQRLDFYFVHTHGNPLTVTWKGAVVAQNGVASPKWDPAKITTPASDQLQAFDASVETTEFIITIPSSRSQTGSDKLVITDTVDGATVDGDTTKRFTLTCMADGDFGQKHACTTKLLPMSNGFDNPGVTYVKAGIQYPMQVQYSCRTNGYVFLNTTLYLGSGFAPINFAWRKACAKTPGLQIASSMEGALNPNPDIADQGTVRPSWRAYADANKVNKSDTAQSASSRSFYFWVKPNNDPKAPKINPAVFTNATSHSSILGKSEHPIACEPQPVWTKCASWNPANPASCEKASNPKWTSISITGYSLGAGEAPVRATFDYSGCTGQGAVLLDFSMRFGQFDSVELAWKKYLGPPPGFAIQCVIGCPDDATTQIVANGAVNGAWGQPQNPPILANRDILFSWRVGIDEAVASYSSTITGLTFTSHGKCSFGLEGVDGAYSERQGKLVKHIAFTPGKLADWALYFFCEPGEIQMAQYEAKIEFDKYEPLTLSFNKGTQFSHQVQIGTRPGGEDINSEGTPIGGWTFDAAGDCYPRVLSDCQRRGRGDTTDSFWISWTGSTGYGVIPAPQPGDEQQIEGVHNNYFFNYNTSVMHGCQPYWDISQEGLVTDRAAFMKRGYAMIGTPPGENQALPSVKITVNYNCSDAATSCFGADCYTLFTGGLPLNATNCGPSSATASECATPMFRWIKTLLPVPPQAVSFVSEGANATEGVVGGVNLVWEVPQSGDGEWSNEDQKISRYFLQVQDANTYKFVKTYNLTVTPGSALSGPLGSKVFFLVDGLVDKEWYTFIITPTNNDSIVGESNQQQFQAGASSKSGNNDGPTTTTIIIIAAGAGVGLIVLGCLVYHCCISSGKKVEAPYQQLPPGPPATAPARKDFPAAQHRYNPPAAPAAPAAPQDSYSAAINSAEARMQAMMSNS